jgi:hypothetical protein
MKRDITPVRCGAQLRIHLAQLVPLPPRRGFGVRCGYMPPRRVRGSMHGGSFVAFVWLVVLESFR